MKSLVKFNKKKNEIMHSLTSTSHRLTIYSFLDHTQDVDCELMNPCGNNIKMCKKNASAFLLTLCRQHLTFLHDNASSLKIKKKKYLPSVKEDKT